MSNTLFFSLFSFSLCLGIPEGLAMGGGSINQKLLLVLWESEAEKSQLRRELLQMEQEMEKHKQDFKKLQETMEREKGEEENTTRKCHPCPQHPLPRPHRLPHHHRSPSYGDHSLCLPFADELTATIRSDLQKTKEAILEGFFDMKVNWIDCNRLSRDPEGQKQG